MDNNITLLFRRLEQEENTFDLDTRKLKSALLCHLEKSANTLERARLVILDARILPTRGRNRITKFLRRISCRGSIRNR